MLTYFNKFIKNNNNHNDYDKTLYNKILENNLLGLAEDYKNYYNQDYSTGYAIFELEPIIQKYNKYLNIPKRIDFLTGKTIVDNEQEKTILEYEFWKKSQDYKFLKKICNNCDFIKNNTCENCYFDSLTLGTSYNDVSRTNLNTKYLYLRKQHFYDCVIQFQGKQLIKISDELISKLKKMLGNKKNISKTILMKWLKDLNANKHYENIHLIHSLITGISCVTFGTLEPILLDDFEKFLFYYDKKFIDNLVRKNFINVQYILYQLLKRHHFSCNSEDFVLPKTLEIKKSYDTICGEIFKLLKWNYSPLI